jgi:hypothetical protein
MTMSSSDGLGPGVQASRRSEVIAAREHGDSVRRIGRPAESRVSSARREDPRQRSPLGRVVPGELRAQDVAGDEEAQVQ